MKLCPNFENRRKIYQRRFSQFENFHGSLNLVIAKYEQLFCAENCIKSSKRNYDMFVWIIRNYEKCLTLVLWPVWMYKYLHSPDSQWPYGLMVLCLCLRSSECFRSCSWCVPSCQGWHHHLQWPLILCCDSYSELNCISEINDKCVLKWWFTLSHHFTIHYKTEMLSINLRLNLTLCRKQKV